MKDDLISRQAAIKEIARWIGYIDEDMILRIQTGLKNQPSAYPERKTGRWKMEPDPYGFFDEIPVCSECGCTTKMRETYKFCPNCGAKME